MKDKAGWRMTKQLGMVCLDTNGKVVRTMSATFEPLFPYKRVKDGWDKCSGEFTPEKLAQLMDADKAKWA